MMSDHLIDWFRQMESSTDYLAMDALHSGMAYAIWARNAYVGIWMPADQGFLISRYKMYATPRLTLELHWDIGEPFGTAKPLRFLECCPMKFTECSAKEISGQEEQAFCTWLDALETKHPPYPGAETPAMRRDKATHWQQRQTEKRQVLPSLRPRLVCQLEVGNTKKSR
ncbi:hypothetical protein [Acidithiobacillus ferriphilus]|jgi:hypothetical protein|uniref:hypothetical protein n=1 Tax=Acidithiobacillus ferriphilus TaxID=1689834 RepID=UPI001C071A8F|nr:hypothetical protein [Acidithiobacillus ferriphilus]MBU2833905.1 hypothetical protein [Acidithiobacillus ferriphilus]